MITTTDRGGLVIIITFTKHENIYKRINNKLLKYLEIFHGAADQILTIFWKNVLGILIQNKKCV